MQSNTNEKLERARAQQSWMKMVSWLTISPRHYALHSVKSRAFINNNYHPILLCYATFTISPSLSLSLGIIYLFIYCTYEVKTKTRGLFSRVICMSKQIFLFGGYSSSEHYNIIQLQLGKLNSIKGCNFKCSFGNS